MVTKRILSVLICALAAGRLLAMEADSLDLYELHEVEVDAAPAVTEVIPAKRLDGVVLQTMSTQSVADAVRFFSGVQIKDYGGIGGLKTINIRSMGSQHVGIFYDGLPVGNAQNGQIDLGRYSLDNIESVELYHGQKTSMLQSARDYASATSVYLQSKRPRFTDEERYHLSFTLKGGSFGTFNPALTYQQKISNSLYASLSGEWLQSNGRYPFRHRKVLPDGSIAYDTTAIRENGDIKAYRVEGSLYGFFPDGSWKVQLYDYHSARGLPGYVARNLYSHSQRQWDNNFFAQGSFRKDFASWWSLQALAKYANDYTRYLNPDTTLQYIDNTYRQQEIYVSAANCWRPFGWWELALSADWQWNSLDCDMNGFVFPVRNTFLVAAATAFKFERVQVQASLLGHFVHDRTTSGEAADFHKLTPSVSVSYRPCKTVDIHGFYKQIFRMPTFNDLYYTLVGHATLKPEETVQYDLGVTFTPRHFKLEVDGYYNKVTDKIVAVPTSNPFRWQMMNLGLVKIVGCDASVETEWKLPGQWSLQGMVSYTYQQARDVTDPAESYYGDQIPYIPLHSGSAMANVGWRKWNLHYAFLYTGERYDQSANIPANYVQPWYTHDLALQRWFQVGGWRFTLSGEVNNVFNQQYDVVLNYPMPGTNFKVGVRVER